MFQEEFLLPDDFFENHQVELKSRLATKKVVGLTGLVPPEKVRSSINPAKGNSYELYMQFKRENPVLSSDEYQSRYKGISKEIIEKVVEGFQCLVEVYHLYGLERPKHVSKCYYEKYSKEFYKFFADNLDVLKKNRVYHFRVCGAITRLLNYLAESEDSSKWVSYFKYKTCAFFSFHEGQEIPPSPDGLVDLNPGIIFFPAFVRILSNQKDPKKFRSFLMTINQAKMGMPRDCESSIMAAERKCAVHLTTQPPPLINKVLRLARPVKELETRLTQEEIDLFAYYNVENLLTQEEINTRLIEINKDSICAQLKRTVRELFHDAIYTKSVHYEPFYPSTSSNYNRTRKGMGAVGEVMDFIKNDEELSLFLGKELLKLGVSEVRFREEISRRYGVKGELEQEVLDANIDHEVSGLAIDFFDYEFKDVWCQLFDKLFERAYVEQPLVEPLGLLEALKIRVISKGPPFLYTALKPLQKYLWGHLKRNTVFTLIGTPITEELINKVIGRITDEEILVNGDYKASTDNLHSWVSECLANELCDILNENALGMEHDKLGEQFLITEKHREMLIRSLIHHQFIIDGQLHDQKEGQLMGSISSFPFLCLANAAFCRWALELADSCEYRLVDKRSTIRRAPLLINGDDCTLRGSRLFLRKCWEEITSFGGLTSSVGKTFFSLPSHPICMINSVAFDYDFSSHLWVERKYVNMGILLGKKRSIGCSNHEESDQVSYGELGVLHRELYRQAPPEIWEQVSSRFVYYNANTLKQYPSIPWHMPEYLGGPGLVPKGPIPDVDLECATLLIMNMKSSGGFHKKRYAVEKHRSEQEWQLHQCVARRLDSLSVLVGGEKNFKTLRNQNAYEHGLKSVTSIDLYQDLDSQINEHCPWESLEENYSKLYKYVVIESLFLNSETQVFKSKSSTNKDKKDRYKRQIRLEKQNEYSWQNVYQDVTANRLFGVEVRTQHEIMHEKKGFVIPVTSNSVFKGYIADVLNGVIPDLEEY